MLAFESYSKTSFEIIIKERMRAFLFKKMALEIPKFILEGKLKKGDRNTFKTFIENEKWLGECIDYGEKGSEEWKEKQAKLKKFQKAGQTMAIEKNRLRDITKLADSATTLDKLKILEVS